MNQECGRKKIEIKTHLASPLSAPHCSHFSATGLCSLKTATENVALCVVFVVMRRQESRKTCSQRLISSIVSLMAVFARRLFTVTLPFSCSALIFSLRSSDKFFNWSLVHRALREIVTSCSLFASLFADLRTRASASMNEKAEELKEEKNEQVTRFVT